MELSVGPFRVLRVLGEGGMGVVYAAEDERLGRTVALKRVRPAPEDPSARERTWREARVAASISHPNICQVYDVLERDGDLYVAMELLAGEPLSARLARGPMPLPEVLDLGIALLSALGALHAQGLVHRDVKPSNVFLTPYGVKLLDFGLAAPAPGQASTKARLTATGLLLGTPGFMAPEQWLKEPVGPPADLFAVGALLFEAASGRPAFTGSTPIEAFHAVAYQPTPVLGGGTAAAALDRVLQRALAKRPGDRYPDAAAMSEALAAARPRPGTSASTPTVRALSRVIVLPFRMLRPDAEVDFLAYALPEAVATSLASMDTVVVRSPHAAQRFGGATPDLRALAQEAEVDFALAGTLLRGGDRLRLAAQLLETPSGTVRWSETMQVPLGDLFHLQDDLARRIVDSLALPLGGSEGRALQRDVPASPHAYELYLRANQFGQRQSQWTEARRLYEACVAEDPSYAPAWARLGRVCRVLAKYGYAGEELLRESQEAFRRAFDLNPDLAPAHHLFTHFEIEELGRPRDAMVRLLQRARRHGTEAEIFAGLVVALRFCGLLDASLAANARTRRLDPTVQTSVAYTHWMRREFEEAIREDEPEMPWIRIYSLPVLGREEEAMAVARAFEQTPASERLRVFVAAQRCLLEGDRAGAAARLAPFVDSTFRDPEGLYFIARTLARAGEHDLAFRTLDRVVSRGFTVPTVLAQDAWLDSLRDDPRFLACVRQAEEGRRLGQEAYAAARGEEVLGVPPS